jgi:hypothetical protein
MHRVDDREKGERVGLRGVGFGRRFSVARFAALVVVLALVPPVSARASDSVAASDSGAADGTDAVVSLSCDSVSGAGRVQCRVDAHVEAGRSIQWGDVVLVAAPPFVSVLRGRIGPHDAITRESNEWRWVFAVIARRGGRGTLQAHVRLVVCRGGQCSPRELAISGEVVAGP